MATKLSLPQHVKLATLLRSGVRANSSNGQALSISFFNVTSDLRKAKENTAVALSFLMFPPGPRAGSPEGKSHPVLQARPPHFPNSKGGCQSSSLEIWVLSLKPRGKFFISR